MELANGTIALLANNDFSDAFLSAFRVVDFIAVDKTNQVCILFNGAGIMIDNPICKPRSRARNR